MMNNPGFSASPTWTRIRRTLASRFSLHNDKASNEQIDETLRAAVDLVGATPWILVFAILVACIGLNVNSTAVIIGAMLISPLMGPIMGVGYGLAIFDFELVKKSFVNLGIATFISFLASSIYFSLTPLSEAQSELLARTSPTIWDVLIAMFGGAAGIIGATRTEKTNVVPGVAIATALMPPLCTAGYGLSQGNWKFLFGALYLFSINAVFIALSTVFIVNLLHIPHKAIVDSKARKRIKQALVLTAMITAIPSIFLAIDLVQSEIFKSRAHSLVRSEFAKVQQTYISNLTVDPDSRMIEVSLIGAPVGGDIVDGIKSKLDMLGLVDAKLVVHQGVDNRVDVNSIKQDLLSDLYQGTIAASEAKDKKIVELEQQLAQLNSHETLSRDVVSELQAQYPDFTRVTVGQGFRVSTGETVEYARIYLLMINSKRNIARSEQEKIQRWFRVRSKDPNAEIAFEMATSKAKTVRR
jgi:uncharacterized hydrophobic protein (TIGR00271 family)